jgi:K+ transporter
MSNIPVSKNEIRCMTKRLLSNIYIKTNYMKTKNVIKEPESVKDKRMKLVITETQFKKLAESVVALQEINEITKTHLLKNSNHGKQ